MAQLKMFHPSEVPGYVSDIESPLIVQLKGTSSFKTERAMMARKYDPTSLPLEMAPHSPSDFKHPNFAK